MNKTSSGKRQDPFPFVLEELDSIRPTIKRMFGFTSVYLEEKLLFSLRNSIKQPGSNGMWLYTTTEHLESLAREFPQLPRRQLWRSGKKAWVVLASRQEGFEEYAFKACELILKGDQRIGRVTRGGRWKAMSEPPAVAGGPQGGWPGSWESHDTTDADTSRSFLSASSMSPKRGHDYVKCHV